MWFHSDVGLGDLLRLPGDHEDHAGYSFMMCSSVVASCLHVARHIEVWIGRLITFELVKKVVV